MAHGLNEAQDDAVNTLSGPLLVLAGAGTGKTRVVTFRIAKLIAKGTAPDRILAVTFTNKAAREMQERVGELLGRNRKKKPEISTFHSLCVRILRRNIRKLGYPVKFAIYDRGDQESLARQALRDIKIQEAALRPGDLLSIISQWKSSSIRPDEAMNHAKTDKEVLAASGYRRYQNGLKAAGCVDFDDLLLLTEELLENHPEVRAQEAGRFDHILVDEYQDTNGSQYRIVKALAEGHRNLCVVGDDDQSIYSWRGAEVAHILRFKEDWLDAKVVRLETNYRSTRQIIAWANRLIRFNKTRHDKSLIGVQDGDNPRVIQFKDGEEEAEAVVQNIRQRIAKSKRQPRDFAILFRTNEQPRAFESQLRRQNVPYVLLGGQSFFDRKEVRDIMAYFRILLNPNDEISLLRIINTPSRGIGQTSVRKLMETSVEQNSSVWKILPEALQSDMFNNKTTRAMEDFVGLINTFRARLTHTSPTEIARRLIGEIEYQKEIDRVYHVENERLTRWTSVEEVVNALGEYEKKESTPTLHGFLQDSSLDGPEFGKDKESKLNQNSVALMTLHAAKGLEFKEVYMVGMEEGLLPHHRSIGDDIEAIAEERRLCYVGVTRAQLRLTLTRALERTKWGKPRPTLPSRFLFEVTGQSDNPNYLKASQSHKILNRPKKGAKKKRPPEGRS